ncbi:MAG: inorganic phosphate transporter [Candidatus Latescibacterota bacterium]
MTTILVLVIVAALVFDFVNGWNDSANAIATVISTRVLSPLTAVLFAAVLNFVGALVSTRVAHTIGGGLVDPSVIQEYVILASMVAAAAWVALCTLWGLPISGSHSLIGGLVGSAAAIYGPTVLKAGGVAKVLVAMAVSPVLGLVIGFILQIAVYWLARTMTPATARRSFGVMQLFSSGFMAFTHGMNDAQKVMGVITLALFSAGLLSQIAVPLWVMLLCATAMALGTAVGGQRVIKTLGMRLTHLRPAEGFAAETAAGLVLSVAAGMGVPVSTTHTITGSILGSGSAYRPRGVKWSIGQKIVYAWIFTLPATALLGGLLALGLQLLR